ncbi:hypothetical protein AB0B89_14945 [Sphaerisporangium sp. NPDC049002]|uniref:hypothetical protein n=1 Tax=unclassified Sphaerisporangium TaxID=2630420 RepID=UPI0033F17B90
MRTRGITGAAVAAALAGGLLVPALPASAAVQPPATVTIRTSAILEPQAGANLFLKCPDTHPWYTTAVITGYYTWSGTPPYPLKQYRQQISVFFKNESRSKDMLAEIQLECTPVRPF